MNEGVWKWNQAEILRYLGCKGQPVPENVEFLIEECKRELEQCAAPRAVWREFPLELEGDEIRIGAITARSRSLGRNLKDCTGALLFAATLGSQVDIMLHRYGKLQLCPDIIPIINQVFPNCFRRYIAGQGCFQSLDKFVFTHSFSFCFNLPVL